MYKQSLEYSVWVDYVEKSFIETKLKELIESGCVTGATSNPSIFLEAFTKSKSYEEDLKALNGKNAYEKYEALAIADIKKAAQTFRDIYNKTNTKDGYVSIELNPFLANDIDASIKDGIRLFNEINEPNVMIKVPATEAGNKIIPELLEANIPVNATLIFSPNQARALLQSIANVKNKTKPIVLSVFVSRFDRILNEKLPQEMQNMAGIMNSALIYNEVIKSKISNAKILFASTGTKAEQKIPADYYMKKLLAPYSVNTAPMSAIEAFCGQKLENIALPIPESKILGFFEKLSNYTVIEEVYEELLKDGLLQFEKAFEKILESL